MFKALLKKQFTETLFSMFRGGNKNKKRGKGSVILYALLMTYLFGFLGVSFYVMSIGLCEALVSVDLGWLFFALCGIVATVLGVFGSVFMTYNSLYKAKDNDILLSMPIPPAYILCVRMINVYTMAFIYEAVVTVPAVIAYQVTTGFDAVSLVFGILISLLLPLLAVVLSCILGWVIGLIASKLGGKTKSLTTVIASLAFIVIYYIFYFKISQYVTIIINNSEAIGNKIKSYVYPFYKMGMAGEGDILSLVIFFVIISAIFIVTYFFLSRSFLGIATAKKSGAKVKYKEKTLSVSSVNLALIRKEFMHLVSSPGYLLNCGLGALLLIIGAVVAVVKGKDIMSAISTLALPEGIIPLIACGIVGFGVSTVDMTAASVSLEGKNIGLLHSLPISSHQILKAKVYSQLVLTLIPTLICSVCICAVIRADIFTFILVSLFECAFALFCAVWGLVINLKFPNFNWTNEMVVVKQSASVGITLLGNMVIIMSLVGLYFAVMSFISVTVYLIICTAVMAGVSAALVKWLSIRGAMIFDTL